MGRRQEACRRDFRTLPGGGLGLPDILSAGSQPLCCQEGLPYVDLIPLEWTENFIYFWSRLIISLMELQKWKAKGVWRGASPREGPCWVPGLESSGLREAAPGWEFQVCLWLLEHV